jgi:hypothetical protein
MVTPAKGQKPVEEMEIEKWESLLAGYRGAEASLAVVLQADQTVSMVDISNSSDIFQRVLDSEGATSAAILLETVAQDLSAKPLFSLGVYDTREAPHDVWERSCELTVCPAVPLDQLWDAESSLFLDQLGCQGVDVNSEFLERFFAGNYVYERRHVLNMEVFRGPFFTPWSEQLTSISEYARGASIRLADVLCPRLTFWVERCSYGEEAGLIASLPLTDHQITKMAAFMRIARGEDFSAESYEKWFREALFDRIPALIAQGSMAESEKDSE